MTSDAAVYRRVVRRETHAARTVPAVVVASILALLLAAVIVLGVWTSVDPGLRESISTSAEDAISRVDASVLTTVVGVAMVVLAVLMIGLAVSPGRRSRRGRIAGRMAVVVDDGVLANAAADGVSARCGVDRSQVSVTVGRRAAYVRVTPTSGVRIDEEAVRDAASGALSSAGFETTVKTTISDRGVVS